MALPLIWLGAGIAAWAAGNHIAKKQQKAGGIVGHFPGESLQQVQPKDGAIVCCGVYELFEHSGIWIDGRIIELKGNGLIRAISPARFLDDRSGEQIYVACDQQFLPLCDADTVERALPKIFQYSEYHVLNNNCHRFVYQCLTGEDKKITRFGELNQILSQHFCEAIFWQPAKIFGPW